MKQQKGSFLLCVWEMGGFGPFEGGHKTHRWLEVPSLWPQQCWVGISSARFHPFWGHRPRLHTAWLAVVAHQMLLCGASTHICSSHGTRSLPGPLQSPPLRDSNSMAFIRCLRITCSSFCHKGLHLATGRFWHRH